MSITFKILTAKFWLWVLLWVFMLTCHKAYSAARKGEIASLCVGAADVIIPVFEYPSAVITATINENDIFRCDISELTKTHMYIPSVHPTKAYYIQTNTTSYTTNRKIKDPIQVFIDGTPGDVVQIFDKPGVSYLDREKDLAKGVSWPKVGNKNKVYFVKNAVLAPDYYDPILHEKTARMFYKIDEIPNDKGVIARYLRDGSANNGLIEDGVEGWIDSERVRLDELKEIDEQTITEAGAKCCEQKPAKIKEQAKEILDNTKLVQKKYVSELLKGKMQCLTKEKNEVKNNTKQGHNLIDGFKKVWDKKIKSNNIRIEDPARLKAIDALARTIYGEIRGCHNSRGKRYSKAQARIFINRAKYCMKKDSCGMAKVDTKTGKEKSLRGKTLSEAILGMLERPDASLAWNKKDSNANIMFCVPNNTLDNKVWDEIVDIATEAVLDTDKFLQETNSMGSRTFHAVALNKNLVNNPPKWLRKKKRRKDIVINGAQVDIGSCLAIYETPPNAHVRHIKAPVTFSAEGRQEFVDTGHWRLRR